MHFGRVRSREPVNTLLFAITGGDSTYMEIHAYFEQNCAVIEVCTAPWPCAPQQPAPPALHLRGRARQRCVRPPQPQLKPLEFIVFPCFPLMCGNRWAVHAPSIFRFTLGMLCSSLLRKQPDLMDTTKRINDKRVQNTATALICPSRYTKFRCAYRWPSHPERISLHGE